MKMALESKDVQTLKEVLNMAKKKNIQSEKVTKCQVMLLNVLDQQFLTEVEVQDAYLKQGIEQRNREMLITTLQRKAKLESISPGRMLSQVHLNRIAQAKAVVEELTKEFAETATFYLRQGVEISNREILKEAFRHASKVSRGTIDSDILEAATTMLQDLDEKHLILTYLKSAMEQDDPILLEQTYNKGRLMGMTKSAFPELDAAQKKMIAIQKERKNGKGWFGGKKHAKTDKVWGGDLKIHALIGYRGIPMCVYESIEYIKSCDLKTAGLFRVAGNKNRTDQMKSNYENKMDVVYTTIHDASSILKSYIRDLPEPLVPFAHYPEFTKLGQQEKKIGREAFVAGLSKLVSNLPPVQLNVLRYLVDFLTVVEAVPENKMTADNIAIVFAPNLLRNKLETATSVMVELPLILSIMREMITSFSDVFPAAI